MPEHDDNFLKVQAEVSKLQTMYKESARVKTFNALVLGESGSGKSFLLRTARKPIHLDVFDPGGSINLRDLIEKGEIVADTRWELEDPTDPSVFRDWEKETKRRIKEGYFNHFSTYAIDSATTWSDAIMNQILKSEGVAGQPPRWAKDYIPQKMKIQNWLKVLLQVPCDFFLTGHLEGNKDEVSGKMSYRFMTTGKGSITIPLLFDEIYVLDPKGTSAGVEYRILTQSTGTHIARSRLARQGLLDTYEKPDIKNMLKKCGFSTEDKPLFAKQS
jgi:hypothetical protein